MKILFLPRWYPSKNDPMLGLFIKRHAEVASHIADVYVLVVLSSKHYTENEITKEGNIITSTYYYRSASTPFLFIDKVINPFRWFICVCKGFFQLTKTYGRVDLIHVNILTRLGVIAWLIKQFYGIPYVVTEHWSRYINGGFQGRLRILITRLIVNGALSVSTITQNLWDSMQCYGIKHSNFVLLPNWVNTDLFRCPISDVIVSEQLDVVLNQLYIDYPCYHPKRFIHVSCFEDRSKNISGLLRSLLEVQKEDPDFECLLIGDGVDFEIVKTYAIQLGLRYPQVQFMGLVEGERLVELYCSASFMVLFSNYENMPVVIGEAFACGLPVIATQTGGIAEYVQDWNGQLIAVGDEHALSLSILYLLNHSDTFDRQHISNYAEQCFGNVVVEKQLRALYNLYPNTDSQS